MKEHTGQLVTQLVAGDRTAAVSLLEAYLPELHAFVRLRMGPALIARETSEDLVQSVCREALEDLDGFEYRGEREFKSWLFLRAQKKVANRARFNQRQRRDVGREERILTEEQFASGYRSFVSPSHEAIRKEEIGDLERAFEQMPDDYREVVTCAKILGMTHEEIAERLDRTPSATRVLLHRAMVRLAVLLESRQEP